MDVKKIHNLSFTKQELQIAKYIFRHYRERFAPRQLARILNVNHAHANKLCKLLAGKNLLLHEDIGNADYYTFNYGNTLSIKFMEYLISLEQNQFPNWLAVPRHALSEFEPMLEFGCVFGSSIKSREYNDIDVLLVYDKKRCEVVEKIKDKIRRSLLVEKPLRYLEITSADIKKNKNDPTFYTIISECMVFCHPERYVEAIKDAAGR